MKVDAKVAAPAATAPAPAAAKGGLLGKVLSTTEKRWRVLLTTGAGSAGGRLLDTPSSARPAQLALPKLQGAGGAARALQGWRRRVAELGLVIRCRLQSPSPQWQQARILGGAQSPCQRSKWS